MASSFSFQIPCIVHLLEKLQPKKILDIGKGFGKYGFLAHEYIGINNKKRLNPSLTMAQQSDIVIDAIEADTDLLLPHLTHIYHNVYRGDALEIYPSLANYDLVLMIDVIEHLDKAKAIDLVKYFLSKNSVLIIATPLSFFQQELYESDYEHHISHWSIKDFKALGFVDAQYFYGGGVYLVSKTKLDIRGFGNQPMKKLRRIIRSIKNELS
jgi:2-polyprenyl-3-methyl-5-hydroxy-6-metoxy-1,4-benzoquinol methylase